jgi:hypothetical protein
MKITLTTFVLLVFGLSNLQAQNSVEDKIKTVRAKQLKLRNSKDTSTWFKEKMSYDLNSDQEKVIMTKGIYNYPKYGLISKFTGTGNGGRSTIRMPIKLQDKQIVYSYFTMNENELYPKVKSQGEIFFAIITVTDVNATNYKAPLNISSRNHPDYLGEGYIRSNDTQIDFMAFTTPDKGNFAIVNKRIFDLSHGAILLIAPQIDGTLRSMQLKEESQVINPDATSFEDLKFDSFVRTDLLRRDDVIDFFTDTNVKF